MAQHVAAMWVMQNGYVFGQRDIFLVYARESPGKFPCMHTYVTLTPAEGFITG